MKIVSVGISHLLFVGFLLGCTKVSKEHEQKQPNIVLFFVDDLGWQDSSLPFWEKRTAFNDRYKTPNMERLARQGMKFTEAYATPVCSPSRISLMTGMNAARHKVTNWTLKKNNMHDMEVNHSELAFPDWNVNGLSPDATTPRAVYATPLPELLRGAGYHTIHVGKAHFGAIGTPGENPLNLGFDVNVAGHAAGAPASYLGIEKFGNRESSTSSWGVPGLDKYHGEDIFLTEVLTLEAISQMEKAERMNKPFFLYLAHYAVHTPLQSDKKYLNKYLEVGLDSIEAKYASMVEGMDKSLGDVMHFLEEKKIEDNTIILFMSDNGGLSAVLRGGEPHTHNQPLSSGKGSIYEGGIREPMIVRWPGIVSPGSTSDQYLIIEDFFPTILEMAGLEESQMEQSVDGVSFIGILKDEGPPVNNRPLFWHYPNEWGYKGPGIGAFSAIRQGEWKLIYYHIDSRFELFNIKEDIGETVNKVCAQPEVAKVLAKTLGQYLRAVEAQMPTRKKNGDVVPWPDIVSI
ncbi:MAG: sulfatase [Reichenbachiella sp.]|uniref:sulfatase n=1 Tax=Reichenbachiella sp. TaxID=2184521 RepID=UPI003266B676